jgi:hypothetical protein
MSEHKPDAGLVKTPVESICGDPKSRKPSIATTQDLYGLKGPDGLSANGGIEHALVYEDINPSTGGDKPSDSKQFQGVND